MPFMASCLLIAHVFPGDVLQISVVNGVCTGSQAILASMSDFVVAAGDHCLSFAPASVLKAEGGCACSKGISVKCADEAQATANGSVSS